MDKVWHGLHPPREHVWAYKSILWGSSRVVDVAPKQVRMPARILDSGNYQKGGQAHRQQSNQSVSRPAQEGLEIVSSLPSHVGARVRVLSQRGPNEVCSGVASDAYSVSSSG